MCCRIQSLAVILITLAVASANATPLSGTKSIGPTGDYTSIGAAIADIQTQTLGGALVLELQAAYVSGVETFPLVFTALGTTAVNTVTLRPQTGAAGLAISSADTTAATVDLNGAQFLTIDGRPGGAGTAKELIIESTSTSGVALRFINEASNNSIGYTVLRGVNTSATSGVVVFSTTTGANGNDNNIIDHCDIRDGASTPANCLYSLGTITTTAQNNSGNTVSNCNVFNFHVSNASVTGVILNSGNTDWTLISNSFFQTASRAAVAANVRAIYINNASGNNFTVTGNFVGGTAPNAGGTAWTTTGSTLPYTFQGIGLLVGTDTPSNIQGNTIANVIWTSSSNETTLPGVWSGIYVMGAVNIGTVTGNTIGNGTGTGSVSVTTKGTGGTCFGIGATIGGTRVIANNTIGSITVNGSVSTVSASLTAIQVTSGTNTISNNTVGSTTTANSLNAATSSDSATGQQVTGILSSSITKANITGNTVANLNNNYVGTAVGGQIRGIVTSDGWNTITGNTVRNLSTTSRNANASQSVYGIIDTSSDLRIQTVSQNTVHSLANTAALADVSVTGIYFGLSLGTTNVIARNLVHSLAVTSTSTTAQMFGMYFASGAFTAQSNMVRVGIDATGTSTAGASSVRGIYDNGTTAGRNFYHNSVYVGGTQTAGPTTTRAFESTGTVNARVFQNNIFVNARSNSAGTGSHYAVQYGGTTVNPTSLTAGGNIFLASGTGGVLGFYNSADRATLSAWQNATGKDATSAVVDPLFVNSTGDASSVDLHLQASNPAEGGGVPIVAVTDDFDGQTRSALTPNDIGADAANFSLTSDVFAPVISYPLLTIGSTANRVLTGWATITDAVGVSSGANAPRLYFKKSTDADAFGVPNDSSGNGWKYVTATGSGPYSFTLDYSLINGGSVTPGDSIQYFVVAQDAANHLGSSPAFATTSADPPVQNVNGHGAVNSFNIVTTSGSVTVGSGGTYPSLSGASGLFAVLNVAGLTGNLVVNVTSNLTETGAVTLNQWPEEGAGNYTLTIQPDSATMRTISGAVTASLVTLNGADRVTIDGRFGGSGRFLTFRNTSTAVTASTLLFINDASNNTVRNCVVEGAGTIGAPGVVSFSTGTVTGNDSNLVTSCQVRDRSDATGVPQNLIHSLGSSAAVSNSGNTVSNNELFNFNKSGIYVASTGNDLWTLSGNDIYELKPSNIVNYGIWMQGGGNNVITGNVIHDLLTNGSESTGIYFFGVSNTTIARNRIVNAVTTTVYGIFAQGAAGSTLNVVNNQITLSPTASASRTLYGVYNIGFTGSVFNAFHNSIVIGGTETGTRSSCACVRDNTSTHTARSNLFLNLRTGGTGNHFAAGRHFNSGSYTVSHNVYAGTGATAANFMDISTNQTAVPVSFATWQSATGDTTSQAAIAGSGNFTNAMFVDAANGDLHLVPGGNPLVNHTGIPIAGVTDDYDGDARSGSTPFIGSDELVLPNAQEAWRQTWFGITANTGDAADTFDFDRDGLVNLVEFAFGLNPTQNSAGQLPTGLIIGSNFVISITQPAGVTGITYGAEWNTTLSSNPLDWTNITDSDPSSTGYIFSVPIAGNQAVFIRLKVTSP